MIQNLELNPDLERLVDMNIIESVAEFDVTRIKLTEFGKQLMSISIGDVQEFCEEFREPWEHTKPGAMSALPTVVARMKKFKQIYPEFQEDDIIQAGKFYINSLRGNYNYILSTANFILKEEVGEPVSKLADWCEIAVKGEYYDGF